MISAQLYVFCLIDLSQRETHSIAIQFEELQRKAYKFEAAFPIEATRLREQVFKHCKVFSSPQVSYA